MQRCLAMLTMLLSGVSADVAAAGCPHFAKESAIYIDQAAEGSLGALSASFASEDRKSQPTASCAAVSYNLDVGVEAGYRRIAAPGAATQTLSLDADGVAGTDLALRTRAAKHRDEAGTVRTEVSQHVSLPKVSAVAVSSDVRWRHAESEDNVAVAVGNRIALFDEKTLTLRGGLDLRRDRNRGTREIAGQTTKISFETKTYGVTFGRTGSVRPGWQDTWRAEIRATGGARAPLLRRVGFQVGQNAGRTDTVSAWTSWSLGGAAIIVDGSSSDSQHWNVGVDWQLVDAEIGFLSLSTDYAHTPEAVSHRIGLTGEFNW